MKRSRDRASSRHLVTVSLLFLVILPQLAFGGIGNEPATLLADLAPLGAEETGELSYRLGDDFHFRIETLGGLVHAVTGEAVLDEENIGRLAALVGAATGYGDAIAGPVASFLHTRLPEYQGRGPGAVAVEQYQLTIDVQGDSAPFQVTYELVLAQVPQELFPVASHGIGPEDASVVIREFGDFECPYCATFALEVLPELKERLLERGDVRFEYHHLPLRSIHPSAQPAAEAAECVAATGSEEFWSYHDLLYDRQGEWSQLSDPGAYFVELAAELGLDREVVAECLEEGRFRGVVENALNHAAGILGLSSTPTVFVNGYRVANPLRIESVLELVELVEAFSLD